MIRTSLLTAVLLIALPASVLAAEDPRFLTLDYNTGGMFHVTTTPEASQTVLFAPGERIQSVVISDPNAYQIGVTGSGDGITLKANGPSALALVNVRTDQRSYELELVPGQAQSAPSVVRFAYTAAGRTNVPPPPPSAGQIAGFTWRTAGSKALWPSAIRDDGSRTYIEWAHEQALPAIFALGASGNEEMVEGYVRGGVLTIDRVYHELVFRIDGERARAQRVEEKVRRGQ